MLNSGPLFLADYIIVLYQVCKVHIFVEKLQLQNKLFLLQRHRTSSKSHSVIADRRVHQCLSASLWQEAIFCSQVQLTQMDLFWGTISCALCESVEWFEQLQAALHMLHALPCWRMPDTAELSVPHTRQQQVGQFGLWTFQDPKDPAPLSAVLLRLL